jgi:hypothetical protein
MNDSHPVPENNTRIGFQYYPDTLHFREDDLLAWTPMLKSLGAQWLTMVCPSNRAIPEAFIRGLVENGIEPVLHLRTGLSDRPVKAEFEVLLDSYADWGVRYIALFDRPNMQASWSEEDWVQQQLIERYLDIFIEYAELACRYEMVPILSPLEPGGNFWDTAFLRSALQGIKARDHQRLLSRLVIGAYAWPSNRPLTWGEGGPERWPGSRPYFTPTGEQDQIGFRIFDWYNRLSEAAIGVRLPIVLLGTGCRIGDQADPEHPPIDEQTHAAQNFKIAKLLAGEQIKGAESIDPIPDNVLAGNFWLLTSAGNHLEDSSAWFDAIGNTLPAVSLIQRWWASREPVRAKSSEGEEHASPETKGHNRKAIRHYLLLPEYDWGVSEWHLQIVQPFILKHKPTVGFSVDEACLAEKVTIIGGKQSFTQDMVDRLIFSGCEVKQVSGDGTSIATQLAEI